MIDLDEFQLAKLAREMAMNIRNYKLVFEDFGISEEDYYEIEKIEFYKRAKEQFALEWNSALSAPDRARIICGAYAEQMLPVATRRAMRETTPLPDTLETLKLLFKGGGIGEPKNGVGPDSGRFVITINLGADTETYDKPIAIGVDDNGQTINAQPQKSPVLQLRSAGEGEGSAGQGSGELPNP